jgi:tetratricopeptide (TPR) repeat protein
MYLKSPFIQLIYITVTILLQACTNNQIKDSSGNQIKLDTMARTNEAVKELSNQIEREPDNAEWYYQRAVVYFTDKYLDRALSDIEDALLIDAQNPLYYFTKARILYAMNKTMLAAKAYENAITLKPDYEEAMMKLADLYYVVKEHQKSINLINAVVAKNPTRAEAYALKGDNLRELKDTTKAIAAYQKAIEADDRNYDAALQLGLIFAERKNQVAKEYFTTALRINPRSSEAYFGRAYFFQQSKQYKLALADYKKAVDIDAANDKAYYNVGLINYAVQQYSEALRSWDRAIQINNNNIDAYYMRGLVYEMQGDKSEAILNYEYALQVNENYSLAKEALQRVKK